jgi:hypothetical protein
MTPTTMDWAARKPALRSRGLGLRRLTRAINARRELNAQRAEGERVRPDRPRVSVPSYAYLIRSHD